MLKLKKILYPTDFSEASLEALKYATSLARSCESKLILMHVVNEKIFSEGLSLARISAPEALGQELAKEAARQLKMLITAEDRPGLELEMVILHGNPSLEVIRYAKEHKVDMIVIGTAGRSGVEHMMFGSTAEKVVRGAQCPVLSVKPAAATD